MRTVGLCWVFFITPLLAQPIEPESGWAPTVQDYFTEVVSEFVSNEASAITVHSNTMQDAQLATLSIYQDAVAANTSPSPIEVYDVHFNLHDHAVRCIGLIVTRTADINRVTNKTLIGRIRLILLGHCKNTVTQQEMAIHTVKYIFFPRTLPFGTSTGYQRYRSIKNINTQDKTLACVSEATSTITQGPRHVVAIYHTDNEYIFGWGSARSSTDMENPDYPVKINGYQDLGTIEEIKNNIQYFHEQKGRGQIVFKKEDCEILTAANQGLLYLYCHFDEKDPFHPNISQISAEVVMKKIEDSRYLTHNLVSTKEDYNYISTEISIELIATSDTGRERYSTGFDFRNSNPASQEASRECLFKAPAK